VNAKSVVLLDRDDVLAEFRMVDRVLSMGGVERTSHPRGTHDDAVVCMAGVFAFVYRTIARPGWVKSLQ
jgi:hypothetical protein